MPTVLHIYVENGNSVLLLSQKEKYILPKIVDENKHFKSQQRKEDNLHINSWMISNWEKTKGEENVGVTACSRADNDTKT
jgi:hypothetical protein